MKIYLMDAAIQAPRSKKERNNDCLSCGELIKHPLCPCCVSKGFRQWIKNLEYKEIKFIEKELENFHKAHIYYDGKSKRCVSCNAFKTYLCPYCFTEFLYKITKESGANINAMREFLFIFNFDFEHKGYSKELDILGGY